MNGEQWFQLWLALLTALLGGFGVVIWWFAKRVMDMPRFYALKVDVEKVADDWKGELTQLRQERRYSNIETQRKLDKIDDAVTGIHQRIDSLFDRQAQR